MLLVYRAAGGRVHAWLSARPAAWPQACLMEEGRGGQGEGEFGTEKDVWESGMVEEEGR